MSERLTTMCVALLIAILSLPGCAATPEKPSTSTAPPPSVTAPSPAFENPIWDENFPDPMIYRAGATYWAVATNGNGSNVQTLYSRDLTQWEQGSDALPHLPRWTTPGRVWAPEVAVVAKNSYVLYYTSMVTDSGVQCIGVAVGAQPQGPFRDSSNAPLVCEKNRGGSIDAHAFRDTDGSRYLYWKNDGNAVGVDTYISVQRLNAAGTKLVGQPKRLFKETLGWEGRLVEAPFMWKHGDTYHLFYSANAYDSADYAVGHAVADSPLGPFTKDKEPVLVSNSVAAGPGHCALFERNGKVWMAYHAWPPDAIGLDVPGRAMWLSEVTFAADGGVTVAPPTTEYPHRP